MREISRLELAAPGARSLVWHDEGLVDVAAGWRRYGLGGSEPVSRYSGYGRGFDAAVMAPAADVVALVASTGTKALLLEPGGKFIRELNRSYYHAEAYRYPLALFTLPDGRTGLVHCPEEYNRLEVDVARTGERLTGGQDRDPDDFFHSRLAVSQDGRFLLSAGWVWHPLSWQRSMNCPARCNSPASWTPPFAATRGPRRIRQLAQTAGDLLALGGSILALYQCPRLYDAMTGELQAEWPGLDTGRADSSIVWDKAFSGTARVAIDEPGQRFAVTDGEKITVIQLG